MSNSTVLLSNGHRMCRQNAISTLRHLVAEIKKQGHEVPFKAHTTHGWDYLLYVRLKKPITPDFYTPFAKAGLKTESKQLLTGNYFMVTCKC